MAKVYGRVHSLIWLSVLKAYDSFKCVCIIELYVMSDQSEQKNSQRNFVSDQSVFDAMVAPGVDVQLVYTTREHFSPGFICFY